MSRVALAIALSLSIGSVAVADEASHREVAIRLLEVTNARNSIDQIMESMDSMMAEQLAVMELPDEGREAADQMRGELMAWFARAFDWETLSEFMVDTWVEVFTEGEIQGMVDFYLTPLGQKVIEKQPLVMQRSMEMASRTVRQLMPELQSRMQAIAADLQAQYGSGNPAADR